MDPELIKKKREYEARKARTKLALNICTICGADKAKACEGCGTTAYCSTACQRIDWRDRGHRKVCKKIQAAEAARAEAPTPPPSPPVFYGPAPRSHADEVRARIAAEHEAARERREANPAPEPLSARHGTRCPICLQDWDVNIKCVFRTCCARRVCVSCTTKTLTEACPLCRTPSGTEEQELIWLRRHVQNEIPEAIKHLGDKYLNADLGLAKNAKKAAKLYKRAVELGDVDAMCNLAVLYSEGEGVKTDLKKATQLYQIGADKGDAMAMHNLAALKELEGNHVEALRLFKCAADQGLAVSECNVGTYYGNGEGGVEQDFVEARRWFARAAARGYEPASEMIAKIDSYI